jgi:hypothetical protein
MPLNGFARPDQQTGSKAFDAARSSAQMQKSATLADANKEAKFRLEEIVVTGRLAAAGRPGAAGTEDRRTREGKDVARAGGRIFAERDGVWTDVGHRDSLKLTTIAPFSAAYFALVRARPALRSALAVGTPVLIAGRRVSLKVADGGLSEWTAGALERFLQEFDGR